MQLLKTISRKIKNQLWEITSEYEGDYREIIRQKELKQIPFLHQSPQIMFRKDLVNYLKCFAAEKSLTHCCLHLAIYIMDIFMDNHTITPKRLLLVANVCLLLAAKLEENCINIPKLRHLNANVDNCYPINDYKTLELFVLSFFDYYLMFPTAAHYTHYFMRAILDEGEYNPGCYRKTINELQDSIRFYLDKIIDDVHFMQMFAPSLLAAAVISAARIRIGLPKWSDKLQEMTGFIKEEVEIAFDALIRDEKLMCEKCKNVTHTILV